MAKRRKLKLGLKFSNKLKRTLNMKCLGLPNLGNTCYMNSVIQVLLEIFAKGNEFSNFQSENNKNEIINSFKKLLSFRYNAKKAFTKEKKNLLGNILHKMKECDDNYEIGVEYDAVIFYRDFVNSLCVENKFIGTIKNNFICSFCGQICKETDEDFLDINYSNLFYNNQKNHSEEIPDYFCQFCTKLCIVKIKKEIVKYPNTLVLLFSTFPFEFQLDDNVNLQLTNNELVIKYELIGIVYYDKMSEHYTSEVYSNSVKEERLWYYFNDMEVSSNEQFMKMNPKSEIKMLFYIKI